jgi:hypothetical protein
MTLGLDLIQKDLSSAGQGNVMHIPDRLINDKPKQTQFFEYDNARFHVKSGIDNIFLAAQKI